MPYFIVFPKLAGGKGTQTWEGEVGKSLAPPCAYFGDEKDTYSLFHKSMHVLNFSYLNCKIKNAEMCKSNDWVATSFCHDCELLNAFLLLSLNILVCAKTKANEGCFAKVKYFPLNICKSIGACLNISLSPILLQYTMLSS